MFGTSGFTSSSIGLFFFSFLINFYPWQNFHGHSEVSGLSFFHLQSQEFSSMGSRACKAGEGGKARETQFALYKMGFLPYFKGACDFLWCPKKAFL